jgi:hypothetical protein
MRIASALPIAAAMTLGAARVAMGQTATQTVTSQITAINQIASAGAAPALIANTAAVRVGREALK